MVRKILLSLIALLGGGILLSLAQSKQISGTVTGPDGKPVAGATVMVDGSHVGTTSNGDGSFTITAPGNGSLVVSFIGYETQKVAIGGKTRINISLKEDTQAIDDVIVVAFGTAKKDAFTGAAKVIKSDDLIKTQSSNVGDALVGKIAGVQFSSASGRPGSGQKIYVRGYGSMNAKNDPLWVVDGVPYEGDINNINAADIESISVLKDAASNALYGSRGANGVIMVTTKRAKAGEATVTFDGKWGINTRALQTYDIVEDAGEYYEMHYKSLYNYYTLDQKYTPLAANIAANKLLTSNDPGGLGYNVFTVPDGQNLIGENGRLNPRAKQGRLVTDAKGQQFYLQPDNWLDEIYKSSSFRQEYNVSVSGATDRANFFASLGYLDNTGIVDGSSNERYTARLRADYQAKKWLKVGGNMSYTHFVWNNGNKTNDDGDGQGEGNADGGNAFATAIRMAPIYPVYMRDGNGNIMIDEYGFKMYDTGDGRNGGALRTNGGKSNDLQDIQLNKYINEGNAFMANGFADFSLYKGLKLTLNGSVSLDETRGTQVSNPYYGQFAESGGAVFKSHSREIAYNMQQFLTYTNTFADVHNLDLLFGHEMYNRKSYGLYGSKTMMFSPDNTELSGAVVDSSRSGSSVLEYNNEGYFFRGQYDYDNRIYFSGSYRRDASSRFHPDHRWGNFWSLGGAWIISKENFMESTYEWLDNLKLKASIGSQGNDNIGNFRYTNTYTIENANGKVSTVFNAKGSENITWETNSNFNAGVEFSFLRGTVSGGVEYFLRKTTDMLLSFPVAPSLGYSSYYANVGDMRNSGVEIELNFTPIRREHIQWDINLNMTHLRNKITMLPSERRTKQVDGYSGYVNGSTFFGEGLPMYTFYMRKYAGVSDEGLSMWYMDETDDKGNPTGKRVTTTEYAKASDYLCGDPIPDLYGGFGTSVNFRGFDLSVAFTYQIGGLAYDSGYSAAMYSPANKTTGMNWHKDMLDAWSADNTSSNIPRLQYEDKDQNGMSDRFLMDASYLNLQNINFGYTLPSNFTKKVGIEKVRVYLACENVWYWSKRQGFDPRYSYSGATSQATYSPVRTISGGINIQF